MTACMILLRHLILRGIHISLGYTSVGHTSIRLDKKSKLLTGLTCVLKENHKYAKYAQKINLEVMQLFRSKHANLIRLLI
jgi:hypothetical protein